MKPPLQTTEGKKRRPRVLVIDDSEVDREVMQEILSNAGCDVHVLPSPIGASKVARELNVDVVVVDQNLPSLDGNKLVALLRKVGGLQDLQVILVSGASEVDVEPLASQANVNAFISKRHLHDQLAQTVQRLAR